MSLNRRSTLHHYTHWGQGFWEKDLRLTSQRQRTYLSVLFHSQSQVWMSAYAWKGGSLWHAETRKQTVPFPSMSLQSTLDLCHVWEVSWDSLKLQLTLSERWIYLNNSLQIILITKHKLAECQSLYVTMTALEENHRICNLNIIFVSVSEYSLQSPESYFLVWNGPTESFRRAGYDKNVNDTFVLPNIGRHHDWKIKSLLVTHL